MICKQWRCFIDEFCLDELILFINNFCPTLELWRTNDGQPPSDHCLLDSVTRSGTLRSSFWSSKRTKRSTTKLVRMVCDKKKSRLALTSLFTFRLFKAWAPRVHQASRNNHYHSSKIVILTRKNSWGHVTHTLSWIWRALRRDRSVPWCPADWILARSRSIWPTHPFSLPIHHKQIQKLTCFYNRLGWMKELENLESFVCHSYREEPNSQILFEAQVFLPLLLLSK